MASIRSFNVYLVTNLSSNKRYVGITTKKVMRRWNGHVCSARAGGKTILQQAIRKYGETSFTVEHIASSSNFDDLKATEIAVIAQLNTVTPHGYNCTIGGDGVLGYKPTPETLKRLSESHKGFRHTAEARRKIAIAGTGRRLPPDVVADLRAQTIERWKVQEFRDNMLPRLHSFVKSDEGKKVLSQRIKKQLENPDFAKNRDQTGRRRTAASRKQMSESRLAFFERDRERAAAPVSKLTAIKVAEIKSLLKEGSLSQVKIAKRYGVVTATIWYIANGVTWKWVEAA